MNYNRPDQFDVRKLIQTPPILIGSVYLIISIIGFLYTLILNSGSEINVFNYYEITDYLLIGIMNYKVLLVVVSVTLIINILLTVFDRYLLQIFYKAPYGQDFDEDSKRSMRRHSLRNSLLGLLLRLPVIVLLLLSILNYQSHSNDRFLTLMAIGILYYILVLILSAITRKEVSLDGSGIKVLIYSLIIISIFTSIILGYIDRNSPPTKNHAIINIEDKVLEGTIIGTSKNHIFFRDSTEYVLNRDLIKSIQYLGDK